MLSSTQHPKVKRELCTKQMQNIVVILKVSICITESKYTVPRPSPTGWFKIWLIWASTFSGKMCTIWQDHIKWTYVPSFDLHLEHVLRHEGSYLLLFDGVMCNWCKILNRTFGIGNICSQAVGSMESSCCQVCLGWSKWSISCPRRYLNKRI